jgi:hypothetical protein
MDGLRGWRRLARGLAAAIVLGASGCLCYLHPVEPVPMDLVEPCQSTPKCARDHVYVFLIHGMDPLDYANLTGLRDYIHDLGFQKTYYGQLYHTPHFDTVIHQIHEQDPEARFVLIGFSFGANMVRDLANSMNKDGIPLDLLVYLGGNTLHNNEHDQPPNTRCILNILATGAIWHGDTMDRAENTQVTDRWHFGSPTHRVTLEKLTRALAVVAASVPVPEPVGPETAPAPRPAAVAGGRPGEWDFLKPVSRLRYPAPAPAEAR